MGLRTYDDWTWLVREDQWIKSIAMIDAGVRVTLQACRRRTTAYAGGFTIDYARTLRRADRVGRRRAAPPAVRRLPRLNQAAWRAAKNAPPPSTRS